MLTFQGICASEGFAMGPVFRLRHSRPALGRRVGDPRYELALYDAAMALAVQELTALTEKASADDADIFEVQHMMLEDAGLVREVHAYIRAGAGAAAAVERAAGIYSGQLRALQDGYLSERGTDVLDACHRVVDILDGSERTLQSLTHPSIIVGDEIYPTDLISIDRRLILGVVTSQGSTNAHAAIIARSIGIPFVVMAGGAFLSACSGQTAALDGAAATVYLAPDEVTKARFAQRRNMAYRHSQTLDKLRKTPCRTQDGVRVQLYANCLSAQDVALAISMGAEGIGLLRSELTLTGISGEWRLDEPAQYTFYRDCLTTANGRPVYVTTFDLGADKTPSGIVDSAEPNPALGMRGVRYSLAHKTFLGEQLMALLRAAVHGPLHIVLPMVTMPADITAVREELDHACHALRLRGEAYVEHIPVGIIIETPAAALQAEILAPMVDFFQIGTNDLAQYTMAADRTAGALLQYLRLPSPPVLRLIDMVLQAAQSAGIPVSVCGESAAEPGCALELVRRGLQTFFVGPRQLPELKAELLECTVRTE